MTTMTLPRKPDPARGWPDKVDGRSRDAVVQRDGNRPGWHGALDRLMGVKSPGQVATEGRARAEQGRTRTQQHHAREAGA